MDTYYETSALKFTNYSTTQKFPLSLENNHVSSGYVGTHAGPWGWQWRDGVRPLVSISPSSTRITIKALMDDIEKDAPGMYRTVTDLVYSRSPQCPFIVDEPSMAELRNRLDQYEDKSALLSPDAQVGVRKSVAAALGERKDSTLGGQPHAAVYPYSVDVERIVDNLCGSPGPPQVSPFDEFDSGSGTMTMDLGTEYSTPSIPSEFSPSPSRVVGSKIYEVADAGRVNVSLSSSSSRRL